LLSDNDNLQSLTPSDNDNLYSFTPSSDNDNPHWLTFQVTAFDSSVILSLKRKWNLQTSSWFCSPCYIFHEPGHHTRVAREATVEQTNSYEPFFFSFRTLQDPISCYCRQRMLSFCKSARFHIHYKKTKKYRLWTNCI
jgi:hypothetical protein